MFFIPYNSGMSSDSAELTESSCSESPTSADCHETTVTGQGYLPQITQPPVEVIVEHKKSRTGDSTTFPSANTTAPQLPEIQVNPTDLSTNLDPRRKFLHEYSETLSVYGYIVFYNKNFYFYNGTYHEVDENDNVRLWLSSQLRAYVPYISSHEVDFVHNQLKIQAKQCSAGTIPNNPDYFLYRNALADTYSDSVYPPNPSYFATGAINANFSRHLSGNHPFFDQFLRDIAGNNNELILRIWEVIAYILSPEYRQRCIFCLIGVGGAGKSLLLNVIQNLLTPSLVTNMDMSNLLGSRFALSELSGKRICIASDEADFRFSDKEAAVLKRISGGGEQITADIKGKAQHSFVSTAKIVIASNHAIHVAAAKVDRFLKERLVVIPFVNPIPREKQDETLLYKILSERDSIATDAYFVFQKLRANHFIFTGNNGMYEEMAAYAAGTTTSTDPISVFSYECCQFGGDCFTSTEELFEAFQRRFNCFIYKDITAFSRDFSYANLGKVRPKRKHSSESNLRGFEGVKLIENLNEKENQKWK